MVKVIECKICGHKGGKQNPLGIQGLYRVPYCCNCLNEASKKAGNDPSVKRINNTFVKKEINV
jgi:hypothetical protein